MRKKIFVVLALILTLILSQGLASAQTKVSRYTGITYTHNYRFDNHVMVQGLDVSIYQHDIDWKKAKADGIDFAIIRVGGRFSGNAGGMFPDTNFERNIRNAKDAGVMVGLYFFSQAITQLEATAEAEYSVRKLESLGYGPKDLDLPIFMDYEFTGGSSGRLTKARLTKSAATKNAIAFMETIKSKGYKTGLYANLGFLNNTVDGRFLGNTYPIWAAQYYSMCQFQGNYQYWQYSSSGKVEGINAKNDCNVWYIDPNPTSTVGSYNQSASTSTETETAVDPFTQGGGDFVGGNSVDLGGNVNTTPSASAPTKSIVDCQAQIIGQREFKYNNGISHKPQVSVTYNGQSLTEGVHYNVRYINNTQAGQAHVMVIGIGDYADYKLLSFNVSPQSDFDNLNISHPKNRYYTGLERGPLGLNITDGNGKKLYKNLDYTYSVSNNVNAGLAELKLIFTGNYSGTKALTYKILKAKQNINIDGVKSSAYVGDKAFNIRPVLKYNGVTVKYKSSNHKVATVDDSGKVTVIAPGTTEITIEALGTSNVRSATKTFVFTVLNNGENPPTVEKPSESNDNESTLTEEEQKALEEKKREEERKREEAQKLEEQRLLEEAEAKERNFRIIDGVHATDIIDLEARQLKSGKIKVSWKKSMSGYGVDYYQVWRSERRSSGYKKIFTTTGSKKMSYLNSKGIKSGKKYWYKVRGVREVDGKLVYTPFTKVYITAKRK